MIVLFLHSLLPQKDRKQDGIPEPGQCDTNLTRDEESRDWVYRTSFWVGDTILLHAKHAFLGGMVGFLIKLLVPI